MSGIFSIDGNIGSGKSTAVGLLKGKFGDNVIFVDEPVDIWNSIKNKEGETVIDRPYENFNTDIIKYLIEKGVKRMITCNISRNVIDLSDIIFP